MPMPLRIDFVSDVACPWCVVGLRSLMKALDAVGDKVEAEIHFQPFELNPDMPPEGENTAQHVARKYGANPERSAASRNAIREHGEALGFDFNYRRAGSGTRSMPTGSFTGPALRGGNSR
jgi:predicted DsbA family dithiol-disulfide isomerase